MSSGWQSHALSPGGILINRSKNQNSEEDYVIFSDKET